LKFLENTKSYVPKKRQTPQPPPIKGNVNTLPGAANIYSHTNQNTDDIENGKILKDVELPVLMPFLFYL